MRQHVDPVVHLELCTSNLACACAFYEKLFGWRTEKIDVGAASYYGFDLGAAIGGGIVEHECERALWRPYVEVPDIWETTEWARGLGATVRLAPREGPAGWRSVVSAPAAGEVALWQPKH